MSFIWPRALNCHHAGLRLVGQPSSGKVPVIMAEGKMENGKLYSAQKYLHHLCSRSIAQSKSPGCIPKRKRTILTKCSGDRKHLLDGANIYHSLPFCSQNAWFALFVPWKIKSLPPRGSQMESLLQSSSQRSSNSGWCTTVSSLGLFVAFPDLDAHDSCLPHTPKRAEEQNGTPILNRERRGLEQIRGPTMRAPSLKWDCFLFRPWFSSLGEAPIVLCSL